MRCLLGDVFDGLREGIRDDTAPEDYERMREEFIFHMTDWREDLAQLHELLSSPEKWKSDAASAFIAGFLYHVVPHVKAASQLLLDDNE